MGWDGKKVLIYGYGNPGRQDDGLGVRLVEELEKWAEKNGKKFMSFDSNYQLNIEDAHTISTYDLVIFADASVEKDVEDVKISRVEPTDKTEFTMHAMLPGFILHLCRNLYPKCPSAYLLSIRGYEFEFMEGMTHRAEKNLQKAMAMMTDFFSMSIPSRQHSDGLSKLLEDNFFIT